jgi:L-rhamnose mutarotase
VAQKIDQAKTIVATMTGNASFTTPNPAMASLAAKPRQSEWEAYVSQFQKGAAQASAAEKWQLMERIYQMDK